MKSPALAFMSSIFVAFLASCGNVTPLGNDGGAGKPATGSAGSTGAAGTGAAGTGSGTGAAGTGMSTGAAGTGSPTGAAGSGTSTGAAGTGMSTGAAGTGAAGTGMSTGVAGAGAAGMGAAGTSGGNRPCVDKLCQGACLGDSCGGTWTCDPMVACIELAAQYCGCDGKTFTASGCSPRAYAHRGSCEAGVSCDPSKIICKRIAPICPAGQVPSVEGTCYGPCVKVESCNCTGPMQCPEPNQYTCHNNVKRCGPYVN
jgi:hypothetical protein